VKTAAANLERRKQHSDRPIPPGTPGKIRAAREALSWTQAELAAISGVSVRGVQAWEAGTKEPKVASLAKLAKALGKQVADLLPDAQKETP
jgi:transcriptional regulator with XRE-family HTH domain